MISKMTDNTSNTQRVFRDVSNVLYSDEFIELVCTLLDTEGFPASITLLKEDRVVFEASGIYVTVPITNIVCKEKRVAIESDKE